jgi:hypothetical protein
LASGGSATRSGTEINRGRRDDVTKHARFVVGAQFNIAQFSTHYPTILSDLAACGLSSSSRRCPVEDRRNRCPQGDPTSPRKRPQAGRGEAIQALAPIQLKVMLKRTQHLQALDRVGRTNKKPGARPGFDFISSKRDDQK